MRRLRVLGLLRYLDRLAYVILTLIAAVLILLTDGLSGERARNNDLHAENAQLKAALANTLGQLEANRANIEVNNRRIGKLEQCIISRCHDVPPSEPTTTIVRRRHSRDTTSTGRTTTTRPAATTPTRPYTTTTSSVIPPPPTAP